MSGRRLRKHGLVWTLLLCSSCHAALGIEEAEEIESGGSCSDDEDCDDANACTVDSCAAGTCAYDPLDGDAASAEQTAGDCQKLACDEGVETPRADDTDLPIDDQECTQDGCSAGVPSNAPLAAGSSCSQAGGAVCNGEGQCSECFSNAQCTSPDTCGGGGTDWACGCTPVSCESIGLTCGTGVEDGCGNPTFNCNNGVKDGSETDVDCGGATNGCATRCNGGKACGQASDCASGVCDGNVCA